MHIQKYDRQFTRRHFLAAAGRSVVGAGMLAPLWETLLRDGDATKA